MLLVTGATGFVGAALVAELVRRGWQVRAAVRDPGRVATSPDAVEVVAVTDPYAISKTQSEGLVLAAAERGQDAVIVSPASVYGPSPRGPRSYNMLLGAVARGQVREIVDARIGWVLAEDVAIGHVLAFEHGRSGRRYILCGEVAAFSTMLNTYAELAGSSHLALPPGSVLSEDAQPFAMRSQMFGMLAPQRIDDAQARALGFAPRGIDEGLRLTASWMRSLHPGFAGPG